MPRLPLGLVVAGAVALTLGCDPPPKPAPVPPSTAVTPPPPPPAPAPPPTASATTPPPPPTAPIPPHQEGTMFVHAETVECEGAGPMTCLQVKPTKEADWELFYDAIEGFEREPGFFYELKIAMEPVENPPADGSSIRYLLVEVVSKSKDPPE